jgi:transcriptional regulator with XRE-family HTH domain
MLIPSSSGRSKVMSKLDKLPEIRKEAFIKAREALGLTAKDVSGMSCFSLRQIEQIENGEMSSFYGEQNKVTAAKRVAELLKLSQEEAFDFGATLTTEKEPAQSIDSKKPDSQNELLKDQKVTQSAKVASKQSYEAIGSIETHKTSKKNNPKNKLLFLLGIAAALIFSVVNLRPLFFPEPPKEEVVIVEEVVQAPEPELKPEAAASLAVVVDPECPPADPTAINFRPEAPKKPGDMVYAQSKTAQTICVVDATGKTQLKTLEPGVGVSIYGKAPLKVLTGGLNQVDLFYQGDKVRLKNVSGKTILLEPVEVNQPVSPAIPASPADSQLR